MDTPVTHAAAAEVSTSSAASAFAVPQGRRIEASGAVRILRLLVVGTIVVPVLLGAVGAYLSYQGSFARARTELVEAVALAAENTLKVLETHQLAAARIDDALEPLSDAEIRGREQALHERLAAQIRNLPQVAAAWAIDANGQELVSARVFPVNHDLDHSGREDFKALQIAGAQTFIWALRARSFDKEFFQPFFTVSRRRQAEDGRFRGIVIVAVAGSYFASFYNSLLGGSAEYTAGIFREDGINLARYPEDVEGDGAATARRDDQLVRAIADRAGSFEFRQYPARHAPGEEHR